MNLFWVQMAAVGPDLMFEDVLKNALNQRCSRCFRVDDEFRDTIS
jgi:hypothetical protein